VPSTETVDKHNDKEPHIDIVQSDCQTVSLASPYCFWITGLSGAGKSTLAHALFGALKAQGVAAVVLDGDELRRGLCSDLGLSDADRKENIRRAGEVARLMYDAGLVVICAFISPFAADREKARRLFPAECFAEVYLSTPLETCMQRDPKGLYAKARAGVVTGLTGWDAPYEVPRAAAFVFDTSRLSTSEMVAELLPATPIRTRH
jgi:adenylyl-sulfate kinase